MPEMPPSQSSRQSMFMAVSIVWELGYLIALPAFAFGFGGAFLDKYLGTSPLFLLTGFAVAFILSCLGVARMIKRVFEEEKREEKNL